jgi:tripartite-type tricarboxylate transporter receptor subunit TctC
MVRRGRAAEDLARDRREALAAIAEALKLPDVRERLANLSAAPIGSTPAETAAFMKQETERYRAIIRSAGVKVD